MNETVKEKDAEIKCLKATLENQKANLTGRIRAIEMEKTDNENKFRDLVTILHDSLCKQVNDRVDIISRKR